MAGLSCSSPGNCTVIGTYATGGTQLDAMFVADEVNGTWGPGTEPPGASTFEGESITVNAMSCASAGNCVAGGQYDPSYSYYPNLPFVVSETNGTWQTPTALTGLGSQVTNAQVTSVSCPSAGNCTVTGYANPGTFVADEVNGVWGAAHLLSVLDTTGGVYSGATLVSCATAGNCVVAAESYVYTERNGTWDGGQAIPGSPGPVNALSCAPDGGCSVGGSGGVDTTGNAAADIRGQAWTASEAGGSWTTAAVLPGIIPLDGGDSAQVTALACTNGGNCDLVAYGGTPEGNYVVLTSDRGTTACGGHHVIGSTVRACAVGRRSTDGRGVDDHVLRRRGRACAVGLCESDDVQGSISTRHSAVIPVRRARSGGDSTGHGRPGSRAIREREACSGRGVLDDRDGGARVAVGDREHRGVGLVVAGVEDVLVRQAERRSHVRVDRGRSRRNRRNYGQHPTQQTYSSTNHGITSCEPTHQLPPSSRQTRLRGASAKWSP